MTRKYGDEKHEAIQDLKKRMIIRLEALYLDCFEQLSQLEVGEGEITRLTQLLLQSREAAVRPLQGQDPSVY